ncbi:hypothetical protein H6F86_16410 [Phormidium sp. FACHB-592]|uniref:Uncharacterized protein n=1 Tax=Stenomitos frigidus AS-A4 TaxID=2933935 RepID=A0ABV0KUG1_9CYAN|nr:hypothetical protein [Phormidium sp. FACHB-592]MBD2075448.1 hypothetical protein [Phormidium sp. FACHB-592]
MSLQQRYKKRIPAALGVPLMRRLYHASLLTLLYSFHVWLTLPAAVANQSPLQTYCGACHYLG